MWKILCLALTSMLMIFLMLSCERDSPLRSQPKISSNSIKTPKEVVKAFCDLDAAGKRLSGPMTEEEMSYVMWPEEPGWDTVAVISGYKITDIKNEDDVSEVTVEYHALGKCCYDYEKLKRDEKVVYMVIKTDKGWKIKSPDFIVPHVLLEQLVAYFERGLKNENDVKKMKQYQDWIQKIKELAKAAK